jgi:hypothetical protein
MLIKVKSNILSLKMRAAGQLKKLVSIFNKLNFDILNNGKLASEFSTIVSWGFFYENQEEQMSPQVNAGLGNINIRVKGDEV